MITLINFADNNFVKKQKLNSFSAKWLGKADKIIEFSPKDIDSNFYIQNKNILDIKRGCGLWLWKPYFILKALKEIRENEYLIYCDSGAIVLRDLRMLTKKLDQSNQSVMLFELPLIECQWTQKSLFDYFKDFSDQLCLANQIMATFVVLKKNDISLKFIEKWLALCCNENLLVFQNNQQHEFFLSHREDQSILSVLARIKGIQPFSDPTDYGKFPEKYFAKDRLFKLQSKKPELKIKKPFFLLIRKDNVFKYWTIYNLKCTLKFFKLYKSII